MNKAFVVIGLASAVLGATISAVYVSRYQLRESVGSASVASAASEDDQQRIVAAVRHTEPSVVALEVTANGNMVVPANPFGSFFGSDFGERLVPFNRRTSGSGFVSSASGLIVTNDHVVHGASNIHVVFANGDRIVGHIFSEDSAADIALVKVGNYTKLPPPLAFADAKSVEEGQWAIAVGEPLELKQTVTVGVVSGFHRDETIFTGGQPHEFHDLLQTSAPINPGNSGGPLVDMDGRVIGINQSVARSAQGIGFAIPADAAVAAVSALEQHPSDLTSGTGFLGIGLQSLDPGLRRTLSYSGQGVVVASVVSGSSADSSGLEPGDVIDAVNGKPVLKPSDVVDIVRSLSPGTTANIDVWRSGTKWRVSIRVMPRPATTG